MVDSERGRGLPAHQLRDDPNLQQLVQRRLDRARAHGKELVRLGQDLSAEFGRWAGEVEESVGKALDRAQRDAWKGWFDHYLPRKFLDNYMDGKGRTLELTEQEMIDTNSVVTLQLSKTFLSAVKRLHGTATSSNPPRAIQARMTFTGPGGALTNGTLGNFTIRYEGLVQVEPSGTWVFEGTMDFYDEWDFDPKPFAKGNRSFMGEIKTMVGTLIPGKPFKITSVRTPVRQTSGDPAAVWAGGTPVLVPDKLGKADQSLVRHD